MMVETVDKEIIRQRINIAKGIVKGEVRGEC